jgi:hypothetical protein
MVPRGEEAAVPHRSTTRPSIACKEIAGLARTRQIERLKGSRTRVE